MVMKDIIVKDVAIFLPIFIVFLIVGIFSAVQLLRRIKVGGGFEPFVKTILVVIITFSAIVCWTLFDRHIFGGLAAYYDAHNECLETVAGEIDSLGYGDQNIIYVTIDGQEYAYIRPEKKSDEYVFVPGSEITIVYGANSMYIMDIIK